tara:strand:+ start:83089 stop:84219 length:1131 start_codon:yes stop_codon:yes gene_type:complete
MKLQCHYFDSLACRSCSGLGEDVHVWRDSQFSALKKLFAHDLWLDPQWSSSVFGSRTKAKFSVAGTLHDPLLGRSTKDGSVVDLRSCQLHDPRIEKLTDELVSTIKEYRLTPYDIQTRKGELKHIILQVGDDDSLMIRFVLRSKEAISRLEKFVNIADSKFKVITANIQPEHSAVLEGDEEIVLSHERFLPVSIGDHPLLLGPRSFVQTNLEIAGKLYHSASQWLEHTEGRFLDLFCGIGGFSAHLTKPGREVVGVELSSEAIESASKAISGASFIAMDAWQFIASSKPFDVVVVNPPRRGLGEDICHRLNQLSPKHILYSSCNPLTLKRDLEVLNYKIDKIQAFEMFPMTEHWEVLCLLTLNQEQQQGRESQPDD